MALAKLARGTRREGLVILARGSCGEGGTYTAAAIHKDSLGRGAGWWVVRVEDSVVEGYIVRPRDAWWLRDPEAG